jgi:hypothetical protein
MRQNFGFGRYRGPDVIGHQDNLFGHDETPKEGQLTFNAKG